jgi:hypothetical protein
LTIDLHELLVITRKSQIFTKCQRLVWNFLEASSLASQSQRSPGELNNPIFKTVPSQPIPDRALINDRRDMSQKKI